MKWFLVLLTFIILSFAGKAQTRQQENDTTIYTGYNLKTDPINKNVIEIDGTSLTFDVGLIYPPGIKDYKAFNNYLEKSIKYPSGGNKSFTKDEVVVRFVIEKDGSTSNVCVVRPCSDDNINKQAVIIIKNLSKWTAPVYKGKPVRLMYSVAIHVSVKD